MSLAQENNTLTRPRIEPGSPDPESDALTIRPVRPRFQILPCRKIGHGHSRVIIYINYDGQESPMLHTKFRENRPAGSGEEDFIRFLPYMGMVAILVM